MLPRSNNLPIAARFLESAILFTFVAHLTGMLSMALLLLPGMTGGLSATLIGRAQYVAAHPWLWRLGWFPWQLTALSDLLFGLALLSPFAVNQVPNRRSSVPDDSLK